MTTVQPSWTWSDVPGVVVEHADWQAALGYASALREAGFAVLLCAGPDARGSTGTCPLLAGEECPLVAGADVVVSGLGVHTRSGRAVVEALLRHTRAAVVAVEAGSGAADAQPLEGCAWVDERDGPRAVVGAVKAAARGRQPAA